MGYCIGIGLCVDTTVTMIKTSGLTIALKGLDSATVGATILLGACAFLTSLALRRKVLWLSKPTKLDLGIMLTVLVQTLLILLYFQKYPIFPQYESPDFAAHVQIAQNLISGSTTSVPSGVLYYGIHYQLASALILEGGNPLLVVRVTMSLLVILSTFIFYLLGSRLFANPLAGLIVALVYSLSGTIWFGGVFNSGLYANFFGIIACLFVLVVWLDTGMDRAPKGTWILLMLGAVMLYFSHYSAVTLLPALLVFPLVDYTKTRRLNKRILLSSLFVVLPALLVVLVYPYLIAVFRLSVSGAGGEVIGSTSLSNLLSGFPIVGYMSTEVTYDIGFVMLLFLIAVYLWRMSRTWAPTMFVPVIWLAALLVVSPLGLGAWRYAFEALVPMTLMASYGLFSLLPKLETRRSRRQTKAPYWKAGLVLVVILGLLLGGSWGERVVADATTAQQVTAQSQYYVNDSISWLGSHTPQNSTYLSISDWRFTYTSLFLGRETIYSFQSQPNASVSLAIQQHVPYIIVTNVVTEALPPVPSLFPWNNFPEKSNANLTLIYSNPDVRIYHVVI